MDWHNRLDVIREKIRFQLCGKGVDTIAALQKYFEELDLDKSGKLNHEEFEKFLAKIGVFLTTQEYRCVYDAYDPNKDGEISFQEFIDVLRKDMSEPRKAIIKQAFEIIDEEGKGCIPLETLTKKYCAAAHPRVRTREKKPEDVQKDFEAAIAKRALKGVVTLEGFSEYYQDINAALPAEKDAYFIDMVVKTWNIYEATMYVSPVHMEKLETLIFEKIRQRASEKEDEGKALMKAMRYVDIKNTGVLTADQFSKLLANIGCVMKPEDVQALFEKFDTDGSKKICCDKIASYFALKGSGNNPNVNPKFKVEAEPPNQVLEKIKKKLVERGSYGIRGLCLLFRKIDASGNKKIDRHEFSWAMKENGHSLTSLEFERLFKYFDRNNDGFVDYDEFLRGIRGDLNERRKAVIDEVYRKLDKTADGTVTIDDLVGVYSVEKHPKFIAGQMTKKEILEEFLGQWDTIKKDKIVSLEEFEDYYKDVSASIDRDDYFEAMLRNAWKLPDAKPKAEDKKAAETKKVTFEDEEAKFYGNP